MRHEGFAIPPDCVGWWIDATHLAIEHPRSRGNGVHACVVSFPPHVLVSRDPIETGASVACSECAWHVMVKAGRVVQPGGIV